MYQICVSGAAKGSSVEHSKEIATKVGEVLAKKGHGLLTGATIGLPNYAAEGYKKAGGKMSLGISPATSKVEHVMKYGLPTQAYDSILYCGLHYVGRDLLLISSADAVISVGGRMGTLHEFTIALECDTPISFVDGSGGIEPEIRKILELTEYPRERYIDFGHNIEDLVDNVVKYLDEKAGKYKDLYK